MIAEKFFTLKKRQPMPYKDLSTVHKLISGIFKTPQTREDWEQYKLSEEQIAFFNENGYLPNVKMLDEKQIEFLMGNIEEIYEFHQSFFQLLKLSIDELRILRKLLGH